MDPRPSALCGTCLGAGPANHSILAEDPHDVDPDALKEIEIVRTVVGGRTVYEG